jgi:hypothetical protein
VAPDILNINVAVTLLWGTPGVIFHKDENPIMKWIVLGQNHHLEVKIKMHLLGYGQQHI